MRGNRATLRFVDRFLACESRHNTLSISSLAFGMSPQFLRYTIWQEEDQFQKMNQNYSRTGGMV